LNLESTKWTDAISITQPPTNKTLLTPRAHSIQYSNYLNKRNNKRTVLIAQMQKKCDLQHITLKKNYHRVKTPIFHWYQPV